MISVKNTIISQLDDVISQLSTFVYNGRVVAEPQEIIECMAQVMKVQYALTGIDDQREKRTKKHLR